MIMMFIKIIHQYIHYDIFFLFSGHGHLVMVIVPKTYRVTEEA